MLIRYGYGLLNSYKTYFQLRKKSSMNPFKQKSFMFKLSQKTNGNFRGKKLVENKISSEFSYNC